MLRRHSGLAGGGAMSTLAYAVHCFTPNNLLQEVLLKEVRVQVGQLGG
jgi:hypothetical protein